MPWTFVRPTDPSMLDGRPLLDVGTGDGQTLAALVEPRGVLVGVDASTEALRAASGTGMGHLVCARAPSLPFADSSFGTVLAADLFHHLDDEVLEAVLGEAARVLRPGGRLVAWWYESPGRDAPDAPRYPRSLESLARAARSFKDVDPLALSLRLEPAPPTVGCVAVV